MDIYYEEQQEACFGFADEGTYYEEDTKTSKEPVAEPIVTKKASVKPESKEEAFNGYMDDETRLEEEYAYYASCEENVYTEKKKTYNGNFPYIKRIKKGTDNKSDWFNEMPQDEETFFSALNVSKTDYILSLGRDPKDYAYTLKNLMWVGAIKSGQQKRNIIKKYFSAFKVAEQMLFEEVEGKALACA